MAKGGFWTNTANLKFAPKMQNRFRVMIKGLELEDDEDTDKAYKDEYADPGWIWYVKSCDKPTLTLGLIEKGQRYLDEIVDATQIDQSPYWESLNMTFVDPSYPNLSRKLMRLFRRAGYLDLTATKHNSGDDAVENSEFDLEVLQKSVGQVLIQQLDADGNPLETWELHKAFPTKVDFGKLDYASDDLVTINVEWYYYAASITQHGKDGLNPTHAGTAMTSAEGYPAGMTERGFTYFKDAATETPDVEDIFGSIG